MKVMCIYFTQIIKKYGFIIPNKSLFMNGFCLLLEHSNKSINKFCYYLWKITIVINRQDDSRR